jgi:hypothetical protein
MEFNGEDKRIRALFCELKREEERIWPLFAKTWNIAEAEFHGSGFGGPRRSPANVPGFAMTILVVSLVAAAAVLMPKYLRLPGQPKHDYARQIATTTLGATSEEPQTSGKVPAKRESGKPSDRLVAVRRLVRVKKSPIALSQQAWSVKQRRLFQWQSPTAMLLRSAGDELFRLVPPINESAQKMKEFLGNNLN